MTQGGTELGFSFSCALCMKTAFYDGGAHKSRQEAIKKGWGLTKELGWVCRGCQENSEPLQKLVPASDQIVKDQPIEE